MSRLKERLRREIALSGPISVSDYFLRCLLDPDDGYYTKREPFGAGGDFVTAPEVSQMFGELVGAWLLAAWQACGRPDGVMLVELGPGRGTLMKDICRTLRALDPTWFANLEIAMVEASPRLVAVQRKTLGEFGDRCSWIAGIDELPARPLLVVGNEFFDALPVRQFQKAGNRWCERMVGLGEEDGLTLLLGPGTVDTTLLPPAAEMQPQGAVVELSPARQAALDHVAVHVAKHGGAGLFFDYGHLLSGFGDTLQAVRRHAHQGIFENPGEADLTAHVDFDALAQAARVRGLAVWTATQGDFLLTTGLLERAGILGAKANETVRERIRGEVERLAAPDAMGSLFKVLAIAQGGVALAGFDAAD